MPTQNLLSPAVNCANLWYQEKIEKTEADQEADVDADIEVATMEQNK